MRTIIFPAAAALTLGLAACGSPDATDEVDTADTAIAPAPMEATTLLKTADGKDVGTVTATESGDGVMVTVHAMSMPPGEHGVHVHTTGVCEGPTFESAGGHWNPTNQMHGLDDPEGQHAGDMPNLEVAEDGTGTLEYMLGGGATFAALMDADGSAFIVHSGMDDQKTDPSGDSGERIACGVFEMGSANSMMGAPTNGATP